MKRQRQNRLLEDIDEHEVVTVAEWMERFQISKATLNRDFTELEAEKKIHKIHGGAASQRAIFTYEPTQHEKENLEQEYKAAIARAAMKYVYQSASFFKMCIRDRVEDHRGIFEAVKARDGKLAKQKMERHLERYRVDEEAIRRRYPEYFRDET